jgi:hypothetical protein
VYRARKALQTCAVETGEQCVWLDEAMARGSSLRLALALFAAWRRLPSRQRRAVLRLGRDYGFRIAMAMIAARRARRRRAG